MISFDELNRFCSGKSIAIVGNSKKLLNYANGRHIEDHDIVLRMNHGYPRDGMESHLGVRTDLWAVSFVSKKMQEKENEIFKARYNIIMRSHNPVDMVESVLDKAYLSDPSWYYELQKKLGRQARPSTGCMIIDMFLTHGINYHSLTVFGFDFFDAPNFYASKPFHSIHSPDLEKKYLMQLLKEKKVELV